MYLERIKIHHEVDEWLKYFNNQLASQRTNNVLVMWGNDFSLINPTSLDTLNMLIEAL